MSRKERAIRVKWAVFGAFFATLISSISRLVEIEGDYRWYDNPYKNWIEAGVSVAILMTILAVCYGAYLLYRTITGANAVSVDDSERS